MEYFRDTSTCFMSLLIRNDIFEIEIHYMFLIISVKYLKKIFVVKNSFVYIWKNN